MAEESVTVKVTVRDLASVKLLYVALRLLHDEMRVEANRRADDLGSILDRFDEPMADGGEEDGQIVKSIEVIHEDGTREELTGEWGTVTVEPCWCGRNREIVMSEPDEDGAGGGGFACPIHGVKPDDDESPS